MSPSRPTSRSTSPATRMAALSEAPDVIYERFLRNQLHAVDAFQAESDLVDVVPCGRWRDQINRYVVRIRCHGLVQDPQSHEITEADCFEVGIHFPKDHLRGGVDSHRVVSLLSPLHVFNANARWPFLCTGKLRPAMGIVDIIYQAWEVLSGRKQTTVEHDALNSVACAWVRQHPDRLPIDDRPLKWKNTTDGNGNA